jgi:predicted AlkP superfamily phosphohydrolase/phosphomutase
MLRATWRHWPWGGLHGSRPKGLEMSSTQILGAMMLLLLVVAILAVVFWSVTDRGEMSSVGRLGVEPKPTRFADMSEFLGSDEWERSAHAPVVFVGIDGASWQFIDPLIDRGLLPNLERIKREGAYGSLRSISCYVSPPAWVTMLTGYLPDKSGVYTYGKWDRASGDFISVNSLDVEVPSVWDVLSHSGGKTGVFNVPMTYPPRPINGVMVTGMMTPIESTESAQTHPVSREDQARLPAREKPQSFSPTLKTVNDDSLNIYMWLLYDTVDDQVKNYDRVSLTVISKVEGLEDKHQTRDYAFDVGHFSPWIPIRALRNGESADAWVKMAIIKTPGDRYTTQISPTYFRVDAPHTYPDTLGPVLQEKFGYYLPSQFVGKELVPDLATEAVSHATYFYNLDNWDLYLYVFRQSDNIHHFDGFSPAGVDVYKKIDRFIGGVMNQLAGRGTLIIGSDHGFGRYTYGIDLNQFFEDLDLLRRRDGDEIDYDETLVFHNIWHLYFNRDLITRDELGRRGIEVPSSADPIEFFERYLQTLARTIEGPDGVAVPLEFRPIVRGRAGDAPDMVVEGAVGQYVVDFLGVENRHTTTVRTLEGTERWWHIQDGVVLAWGDGVRKGFEVGTQDIQDIAPTLLYLLNLPIADDMDGELMREIFEPSLLANNALYVVDNYAEVMTATADDVDRESLEEKLRSLGYIR